MRQELFVRKAFSGLGHDGPDQGEWVTPLDGSWWALSHRFMESDLSLSTAVVLSDPAQRVAHVRWDDSLNAGR